MVNPNGMTLQAWADATAYVLGNYSAVSRLEGDDWQRWGVGIVQAPRLQPFNPPDPFQFDDWQEWGYRLSDALSGIA